MDNVRRLVQHSSASVEWYTPIEVVEAARPTLGAIDLDPASCAKANKVVKAKQYIAPPNDGLAATWSGSVFLNPPGGRLNGKSQQKVWWDELSRRYMRGEIEAAIFIGFSVEILQTTQSCKYPAVGFPFCIPKKRLKYWRSSGPAMSPPHASVIVYLGQYPLGFISWFEPIGAVIITR